MVRGSKVPRTIFYTNNQGENTTVRDGKCIKCGADDVHRSPEVGHRAYLPKAPLMGLKQPTIFVYVCCTCGYMEEYVNGSDRAFLNGFREKGEKVTSSGS